MARRVIFDIRIEVMRRLEEIQHYLKGGREAYLSGLWSGLVIQGKLMSKFSQTTYDNRILSFIVSLHEKPLSDILRIFNQNSENVNKLDYSWFVGEFHRQSRFHDQYYDGLKTGMEYVGELYRVFYRVENKTEATVKKVQKYTEEVIEWVKEELYSRSHIHEVVGEE